MSASFQHYQQLLTADDDDEEEQAAAAAAVLSDEDEDDDQEPQAAAAAAASATAAAKSNCSSQKTQHQLISNDQDQQQKLAVNDQFSPSSSNNSDASTSSASTLKTCDLQLTHSSSSLENDDEIKSKSDCGDGTKNAKQQQPILNYTVMKSESLKTATAAASDKRRDEDTNGNNNPQPNRQNTLSLKVQLVKDMDEVDKKLPKNNDEDDAIRPDPEGQTGSSSNSGSSSNNGSEQIMTSSAVARVTSPSSADTLSLEDSPQSLASSDVRRSQPFLKLEAELINAKKELQLKEEEVERLSKIRDEVESELQELTASLFQEAHRMVGEANEKRVSTEKCLAEATMKIDGLETEVTALKALVLTSTPSQPNRHLHPQINDSGGGGGGSGNKGKPHRRQASDGGSGKNGAQNGGAASASSGGSSASKKLFSSLNASPRSKNKSPNRSNASLNQNGATLVVGAGGINGAGVDNDSLASLSSFGAGNNDSETHGNLCDLGSECDNSCGFYEEKNIDPAFRQEFLAWKKAPTHFEERESSPFLERIFREDVDLCLDFPAKSARLSQSVRKAIHQQTICITPLKADKNEYVKDCPLLNSQRVLCKYLVRLGIGADDVTKNDDDDVTPNEFCISQLARNRITAVCNLFNYLDYIKKGLVKSHTNDVYWEIVQLRKRIVLARLGFSPTD